MENSWQNYDHFLALRACYVTNLVAAQNLRKHRNQKLP